ncbi:MAG: alpha/beta hydrolase [Chloroflexota bacterium]|jgi:pimeloyl-ACP methyl ester carboxylesterase
MSAILIDQDIIHYEVLGRGKPILFLHSWVGSWRYWIPMMQAASVGYRAYALDLYGFGDSAKNNRYSLEAQTGLVSGFLDKLGMGRVAVIGHGLGALVGLIFALRQSSVVDRVMAVGFPLEHGMINNRLRSAPAVELAESILGKTTLTEPVVTDAAKTDPQAIAGSLSDIAQQYAAGLWAKLNTACLLVHGGKDNLVPPPRPEQISSLPENAHLIQFEEGGHFVMLEDSSKFNRLMNDFLALPSGESPQQLQLKEEWKRRVR